MLNISPKLLKRLLMNHTHNLPNDVSLATRYTTLVNCTKPIISISVSTKGYKIDSINAVHTVSSLPELIAYLDGIEACLSI